MKSLIPISLIVMTFFLMGCGGGGVSDSISGGGTDYYAKINSFNVTPTAIQADTTITVSWSIDYYQPAGFFIEFHMNSQPETLGALTRHFYFNGGIPGGVGKNDSAKCNIIRRDNDGRLMALCVHGDNTYPQSKEITFVGSGYAILKACVYDANLNIKCDTKSKGITVQ